MRRGGRCPVLPPLKAPGFQPVGDWAEITLTHRCNQRCFFCYEEGRGIAREPDAAAVRRLLRETRKRAEMVALCGKEAVLRRDILEIIRYGSSIGLKVALFSNGQAFARPGLAEALEAAGCASLVVSFHFPDRAAFARGARVHPKCFDRVAAGLRNLRAYLAQRGDRAMGISTETDMFALNAGRLAEMRGTLLDALGPSGWRMRIGSLLPCGAEDIGLSHALEPMAERRAELARFTATHPASLPLEFVKVPLCLLPPAWVHRCLDVRYVHAGTVLTFNHERSDGVTLDTISSSIYADIGGKLAVHPYRSVCRACQLVAMCRYERVRWGCRFFEPTREQRPEPVAGLTAAGVLARLGPSPVARARVAAVRRRLLRVRFPEERLLAALARVPGVAVEEAWVERRPILAARLRFRGRAASIEFRPPERGPRTGREAILDYLVVAPVPGAALERPVFERLLAALAGARLPDPSAWKDDAWFDQEAAAFQRLAWRRFGRRLWPESGSFGPWRTLAATSDPGGRLWIDVEHPQGDAARIEFSAAGTRASLLAHGGGGRSAYRDLLAAVHGNQSERVSASRRARLGAATGA